MGDSPALLLIQEKTNNGKGAGAVETSGAQHLVSKQQRSDVRRATSRHMLSQVTKYNHRTHLG